MDEVDEEMSVERDFTGFESVDIYQFGFDAGYTACELKHKTEKYNEVYNKMIREESENIELREQIKSLKKQLKKNSKKHGDKNDA